MTATTIREAKAKLQLFYNIDEPTERQAAAFVLYGDDASFLKQERTQTANNISGGLVMENRKTIEDVLLGFRGTKQLLELLCNSVTMIKADIEGNPQEALFNIEEMLEKNISDFESLIYKK